MDSIKPPGIVGTRPALNDVWTIGEKMPQPQLKTFDPLDILPEEIFIEIVAESASEMYSNAGIIISQDILLDLMLVSHHWNVQILSSPVLWVDILLQDEYDATAKAYLALHHSKQAPLALYMYYPTGWWDTLQEHIMANRTRITKLFIHDRSSSLFERPILRQLSPLPSLAGFHYFPYQPERWNDCFGYFFDSPIARTNIWLDRGILEQSTRWELRGVLLECELEDVFDLLEGSECLEEVLVHPEPYFTSDNPTLNAPLQDTPLPWKSLTYRSDSGSFLGAIIARLPKLVELRIRASQSIFCSLMPLTCQLENLSVFEVTMRGKWEQSEHTAISQASSSVREVVINIASDISRVVGPVVETLLRCFPNILHLKLQCRNFPAIRMLTSRTGFQYLKTILLDTSFPQEGTWSNSDDVLEPFATSVERVSYWVDRESLRPLIPLQSNHVKYLEIRCLSLSELDLYGQHWTAMRTIGLDYNAAVNWKGPTYLHLHTINLNYWLSGSMNLNGRNGTKLCCDIALHPEYFPALTNLEFEVCPELDILFILLETRNIATRPGISPISTLVIPRRCPPFLIKRVQELIKGINGSVSNHYDLSIAGNYDIIMDPTITGCADCHRALRFCTLTAKSLGPLAPRLVMDYPESATQILESWDARAEKWYPVETTLRYGRCERSFLPISITG